MDIETEGHHPNPIPDRHHRKIEVQSPLDLAYLQSNLAASAQQKLDLHLPPSAYKARAAQSAQPATVISLDGVKAGPDPALAAANQNIHEGNPSQKELEEQDPLRLRVRELVDAFMSRTWDAAVRNISVNGMDATLPSSAITTSRPDTPSSAAHAPQEEREGVDFTYEAYDSRLQSKLAGLYGELETLAAQVSRLRRAAPRQGAEAFEGALKTGIDEEDAEFEAQIAGIRDQVSDGAIHNLLGLETLSDRWHDDVKAMYERGTGELADLAGLGVKGSDSRSRVLGQRGASLTETVGKVQRARTVAMEFE